MSEFARQIDKEGRFVDAGTRYFETAASKSTIIIPICCREGWDSCPHVINKKPRPAKKNIGL